MVKTLRVTSVLAVILAAVVLASVLGYLRPDAILPLDFGAGGDKQTEKILGGPSAVERFKAMYGNKVPSSEDTTPPLIKQAEILATIINPPIPVDEPAGPLGSQPPRPKLPSKPPVAVSTKFALLGTCYSSNPKMSLAYIRLPDGTYQWVGVGAEIGHVTIKEILKGSIVCWDGQSDVPMNTEPTPETSSLLETSTASPEPAPSLSRPTVGGGTSNATEGGISSATERGTSNATEGRISGAIGRGTSRATGRAWEPGYAWSSPVTATPDVKDRVWEPRSSVVANPGAAPITPSPSTQISREEQESLSQLGDRLKNGVRADSVDRSALADRLISEYKSSRGLPPGVEALRNSGEPSEEGTGALQDSAREELRRRYERRLSLPRPATN